MQTKEAMFAQASSEYQKPMLMHMWILIAFAQYCATMSGTSLACLDHGRNKLTAGSSKVLPEAFAVCHAW